MANEKCKYRYLIIVIYSIAFIFFVFKMFFYSQYVARFPDEIAHISYIAYLEQSHAVVPDFKDMRILVQAGKNTDPSANLNLMNLEKLGTGYRFGTSCNYLGHPPLYYDIMRLSQAVKVNGNSVTVHIFRLRCFSIALGALAMLLILYIGFTRLWKNPFLHCLYAATAVSVPMLAYECAGINNDTLALFGVSLFLLGLLRFSENRRNYGTYLIISLGVFIAFLSKLTAGTIVLTALFSYLVITIIKEKNVRFILSKEFLVSLPVYLVTAAYYIAVFLKTGTVQPTYKTLDPKGFYQSGFYVAVGKRVQMNFGQYTAFYFKKFLGSWTGIGSYVTSGRDGGVLSVNRIAVFLLLLLPLLLLLFIRRSKKFAPALFPLLSVYIGILTTAVIQWLRAYHEFAHVSGYMGGFQSRYYLCGIAALALCVTFIFKSFFESLPAAKIPEKLKAVFYPDMKYAAATEAQPAKARVTYKTVLLCVTCLAYSGLLLYEDFIYFLLHFKSYL